MFVRGHLDVFGESGLFRRRRPGRIPRPDHRLVSSGEDIEFAACAPTLNDVVFAAAMVAPEYRGRSLHRAGIRRHIAIAQALGAHRGMAQISARNHRSLRSYLSEGFRCTRAVEYPDGRRRLLLERDLVGGPDRADRRCRTRRLERLRRHPSRADRYPRRTSPPSVGSTALMVVGTARSHTAGESPGAEAEWTSIMIIYWVGGIASVHDIARRLGAELTLVKTDAAQTMPRTEAYARIVDVSAHMIVSPRRTRSPRLSPRPDSTACCASTTRPLNSARS